MLVSPILQVLRLGAACRVALSVALLLLPVNALALPSAVERAAAEALFNEALRLIDNGEPEPACPKLEESQRLDPGVGTLLYLADCYQQLGKTASAWATFLDASYAANKAGQGDRKKLAEAHASELEPTLSKLVVTLEASAPGGQTITTDGKPLRSAALGVAFPVDPGEHVVKASAPDMRDWSRTVTVPSGPGTTSVVVPALETAKGVASEETPSVNAATFDPAARVGEDQGVSSMSTWGWVTLSVGGAALLGSGLMAAVAVDANDKANLQCRVDDPMLCSSRGTELGQTATASAGLASLLAIGGGALVGTGVVLLLIAPDDDSEASLRMRTSVAGAHGLWLEGAW